MLIYYFLLNMIFFLSILFLMNTHPMLLGLITILVSFFMTMSIGLMMSSFWISYILFLIYLGAIMVLFIYMISLSPNEIFTKLNLSIIMMMFMMSIIIYLISSNLFSLNLSYAITMKFTKLFSMSMFLITLMMMIFLLFSLFAIMKITKFYQGPMRPSFS
uniref:NADH dehydrogenase subunit 6 n=1 Tax=Brachycybe lecontii TaxID=1176341 RepID=S4T1L5_BRALC|nr:NADH dehydrogenase subunit 6 [Brachycybe lecontii]AFR77043.1 NADH dehydrogenase subunit 6 [Brachycybe lecontii]